MAIGFVNISIVSAGRGESVVGLAAYVCRLNTVSQVDGADYHFAHKKGDLGSVDVLLPSGAPAGFRNPIAFCTALERAELTRPRGNQPSRWKIDAQLAKHVILALPKELTDAERRRLAQDWAKTQYVAHGAGCVLALHAPDDPEFENHHAHILVSTRQVSATGLGKKLRQLNPAFSRGAGHARSKLHAEDLPATWREFQNAWFRANGIELQVDPPAAVDAHHLGPARFSKDKSLEKANWAAFAEAQARIREPGNLLQEMTRRRATFGRRDLTAILLRHGILGEEASEIVSAALRLDETLLLFSRETGKPLPLFTTRSVRAQEQRIMDAAGIVARRRMGAKARQRIIATLEQRAAKCGLATEQLAALHHLLGESHLQVLQGIAGADKSSLIRAGRECLEAAGYRVIGLAPANMVACAMADGGFSHAATIDLELQRQENPGRGTTPWDAATCIVVDGAAMVDAERYERLLDLAAKTRARVILVGDEKPLFSVERGGVFDEIKARHGCAEIPDVRHQLDDWAKTASQDFAAGRIAEGIAAYARNGRLRWSDTLDQSIDSLVKTWMRDSYADPDATRFAYASTNEVVERINLEIRQRLWAPLMPVGYPFETTRGRVEIFAGDRIQLHGSGRRSRCFGGMLGTVATVDPARVVLRTDDGQDLHFNPKKFKDWSLGYAGTAYRGQAKTQVYALYDHSHAWNARTSHVDFTRHKAKFTLFVPRTLAPDQGALARQMARDAAGDMSVAHADAGEEAKIARRIAAAQNASSTPIAMPFSIKDVLGNETTLDLDIAGASEAAVNLVRRAPATEVVACYRRLYSRARKAPGGPADALRKQIEGIVAQRGFSIRTGLPDPKCLNYMLSEKQEAHLLNYPGLDDDFPDPTGTYMNVAPLLFRPILFPWSCWRTISSRIRELDDAVIAALTERVQQIRVDLHPYSTLHVACGLAKHNLRTSPLIRDRNTQRERLRYERDRDVTPRPLWRSFRLFQLDSDNDLVAPERRAPFHWRASAKNQAYYESDDHFLSLSATPTTREVLVNASTLTESEHSERSELLSGIRATPQTARETPTALPPAQESNRETPQRRGDSAAAPSATRKPGHGPLVR